MLAEPHPWPSGPWPEAAHPSQGTPMCPHRTGVSFTPHRRAIVELLAEGLGYRQIAGQLGLSRHTVSEHVQALRLHFQARNNTHLVAMVLRGLAVADAPNAGGGGGGSRAAGRARNRLWNPLGPGLPITWPGP